MQVELLGEPGSYGTNGTGVSEDYVTSMAVTTAQTDTNRCIMRLTNKAIGRVNPWMSSRTAYDYKPMEIDLNKRLAMPNKLVTDCSGFVSWVIRQGCGTAGRKTYEKIWNLGDRQCWARRRNHVRAKCRGQNPRPRDRVRAKDFYTAFARGSVRRRQGWRKVKKVTDIQKGDLLVYQIDKTKSWTPKGRNERTCGLDKNNKKVKDSGHIMIIVGNLFPSPRPKMAVNCNGDKLIRYKVKIADSSKVIHWSGKSKHDSRMACRKTRFFSKLPGCGVGTGWIYVWGYDSSDRLKAVSMQPPRKNAKKRVGPRCPPNRNAACHKYAIGRLDL